MNLNWVEEVSELVAFRLRSLLSDPAAPSHFRTVARITNALPVWPGLVCDLCISPDGQVLCYDSETEKVTVMADNHWCVEGAVSAANNYPELVRMLPKRHPTAKECSACSGTGELPLQMGHVAPDRWREAIASFRQKTGLNFINLCGGCHGLGWIE
jgi:hypothetical protein